MTSKYFIALLLLIWCSNTPAQRNREYLDSLHQLLVRKQSDTDKINLLNRLANDYSETENDSSLWFAQRALQLAQKINYTKGANQARLILTYAYSLNGNYFKALETAFQNLQLAEQAKDTLNILSAMDEICRTYYRMNDYSTLLAYARKVKSLVHSSYFKRYNDSTGYQFAEYINWMGHAFLGLNQIDSALYYKKLYYQMALSSKKPGFLAVSSVNLANLYAKTADDNLAFSFYKKGLYYAQSAHRILFIAQAYLGLAKLFAKKAQLNSALYYSLLSLNLFKSMKSTKNELGAVSLLSEVYAKMNRKDSAFKYLTIVVALKDSVFNQDRERQVQNLQFNEMLRQKQSEQARKEAQQQYENRIKVYGLLAALVSFVIIAFILYRNNKQKEKTNNLLQNQKEEIQTTLSELKSTQAQLIQSEKMASLGELTAGIAHEIQNPLNFVNNFSEVNTELIDEMQQALQSGNTEEAFTISNDLKDNEQKIIHHGKRADAIVKGMLQHSRISTGKKEPTDINALADEYLRLSYHGMRAKDKSFNAEIKTDFDNSIGKINIVPQDIGRVLLNLFSNAFYAVKPPSPLKGEHYEPTVTVTTKKLNSKVLISVKDNGGGIQQKILDKIFQPFFTTKPTGQGTGLGLSLSYDIIKAHGGEIEVETKEGDGAEFIVQLPV